MMSQETSEGFILVEEPRDLPSAAPHPGNVFHFPDLTLPNPGSTNSRNDCIISDKDTKMDRNAIVNKTQTPSASQNELRLKYSMVVSMKPEETRTLEFNENYFEDERRPGSPEQKFGTSGIEENDPNKLQEKGQENNCTWSESSVNWDLQSLSCYSDGGDPWLEFDIEQERNTFIDDRRDWNKRFGLRKKGAKYRHNHRI